MITAFHEPEKPKKCVLKMSQDSTQSIFCFYFVLKCACGYTLRSGYSANEVKDFATLPSIVAFATEKAALHSVTNPNTIIL